MEDYMHKVVLPVHPVGEVLWDASGV